MKKRALMHIDAALLELNKETTVADHFAAAHLSMASNLLLRPNMSITAYSANCRKAGIPRINWVTDQWEDS